MAESNWRLLRLIERYNPENDLVLGAPPVTYTDYQLLLVCADLLERVNVLTVRVNELEKQQKEGELSF